MVTFINMVMNGVENGSPDMILVAFDGKFVRKKMRYLPGFVDLIYFKFFNIGELTADTKTQKWSYMGSYGVIWGPPWPEFGMCLSTISTNICLSPKVFNLN